MLGVVGVLCCLVGASSANRFEYSHTQCSGEPFAESNTTFFGQTPCDAYANGAILDTGSVSPFLDQWQNTTYIQILSWNQISNCPLSENYTALFVKAFVDTNMRGVWQCVSKQDGQYIEQDFVGDPTLSSSRKADVCINGGGFKPSSSIYSCKNLNLQENSTSTSANNGGTSTSASANNVRHLAIVLLGMLTATLIIG